MRSVSAACGRLFVLAAAVGCVAPATPEEAAIPLVLEGVDPARGRRAVDSVYWYTAARPESVVVRHGVARVALPAGALGQRVVRVGNGCDVIRPPEGAFGEVARRARRALDVDTVVVTQAQLVGERRNWAGMRTCGDGPSLVRFDPRYLDAGER
jgi:hypothetical protein